MRKLIAIFMVCSTILYSLMLCYAEEPSSIQKELPLAMKYETRQGLSELGAFSAEAEGILAQQQVNLNILGSLYYLGYAYQQSFDGVSLEKSLSWDREPGLQSPIYKSRIYKDYYRIRTEKLFKQYTPGTVFDYGAFIKTSRAEFDSYMKSTVKDEASWRSLTILLQERLMDQLPELESAKRKAVLEEIYSLGKTENKALCQDFIYQVFKSRVRNEFLKEMIDRNRRELLELTGKITLHIKAPKSGSLLLKYREPKGTEAVLQILNATETEGQFSGYTMLRELYGKESSRLCFIEKNGTEHSFDINQVQRSIGLDEKGYLELELDALREQAGSGEGEATALQDKGVNKAAEQLKSIEALYYSKAMEAQSITKELNKYSMYLELKNKNINNNFTKKFEAEKKQWKAALEAKLNKFGPGGMADFAAYIKQFVMLSRTELGQSKEGRVLIARFRNSIVQFRQADDSSLWITDMLYNLKNMK